MLSRSGGKVNSTAGLPIRKKVVLLGARSGRIMEKMKNFRKHGVDDTEKVA